MSTLMNLQHVTWPWSHDFGSDTVYQQLCEPLEPREIQFARAMVLNGGNQTAAMAEIQPDLNPDSHKSVGSRLMGREAVRALYDYLKTLEPPHHEPVEPADALQKLETAFLAATDPNTIGKLFTLLAKYKGWSESDFNRVKHEDRMAVLDRILNSDDLEEEAEA